MKLNKMSRLTALLLALMMIFTSVAFAAPVAEGDYTAGNYEEQLAAQTGTCKTCVSGLGYFPTTDQNGNTIEITCVYQHLQELGGTQNQYDFIKYLYDNNYSGWSTYLQEYYDHMTAGDTPIICSCKSLMTDPPVPGPDNHIVGCPWYEVTESSVVIWPPMPEPIPPKDTSKFEQYASNEEYDLPMANDRAIILPEGGRAVIHSNETNGYQWQVFDGTQWVAITGENAADLVVTTAKLATIFSLTSIAEIRYFDEANNIVKASVSVTSQEIAGGEYVDPAVVEEAQTLSLIPRDGGTAGTYTIKVYYYYEDTTTPVYREDSATYKAGDQVTWSVTYPTLVGYDAWWMGVEGAADNEDAASTSHTINIEALNENISYVVYYKPANVGFKVLHYLQNIDDDNYAADPIVVEWPGKTNESVLAQLNGQDKEVLIDAKYDENGFYALPFSTDGVIVAADGSTEVEIYYDRYYRLMNFELNGGYGVEPIYAKYGTPISVGTPERAGYSFVGWATTADGDADASLPPATMPKDNVTYYAKWMPAASQYTVVYYLENANDDNYSILKTEVVAAETGELVTSNGYTISLTEYPEIQYFTRDDSQDDVEYVVAGDGSTTVSVYYERNEYLLKFYYARSSGNSYQVATSTDGSSKQGGTVADASWNGSSTSLPTLTGYTSESEQNGNTTYYYFTLKAKYQQDLSALWPNAPLSQYSDNVKFVSWGTQYGSGYNTNNSNKNIKGVYSSLDDQLIIDASEKAPAVNHWLVAYWASPTMYTYEIYYDLLEGEEADRTYNGTGYKKVTEYTVGSTAIPEQQTPLSFVGLVYQGMDYDSNQPVVVRFYYKREINNLIFMNNGVEYTTKSLKFGEVLSVGQVADPPLPTGWESGSHEFAGWYTTLDCKEGTEVNWNESMPAHNITLYAKWVPVTYTVNFYLTDADYTAGTIYQPQKMVEDDQGILTPQLFPAATFKVQHGDNISPEYVEAHLDYSAMVQADPNNPYIFVYWKYYDEEDGEWKAFNPTSPVRKNLDLIGVWSSNKLVNYTVTFVDQATGTVIADPITGQALAGSTKSFDAKGGTALYDSTESENSINYQTGYFPVVPSHSITMDLLDEAKNEFTFYYVKATAVPYTVYYLAETVAEQSDSLGIIQVNGKEYHIIYATQNRPNDEGKSVVTEQYVHVDGYLVDAYQKTLMLSLKEDGNGGYVGNDAENVIYFFYTVNAKSTSYRVIHYKEVPQGTTDAMEHDDKYWVVYQEDTKPGEYGVSVAEDPLSIPYYTYDSTVMGTKTSGIPTDNESLVLTFYYTENTATINYVPVGPNGVPWDGTGDTNVTGTSDVKSETVKKVTGDAKGATADPASDVYKFVGWYLDVACENPVPAEWVVNNKIVPTKTDGTVWPDTSTYYAKFEYNLTSLTIKKSGVNETLDPNTSFVFNVSGDGINLDVVIHGNDTVTIDGLTVAETYTITEKSGSWRYVPDASTKTKTLGPDSSSNVVEFVNEREYEQWLDSEKSDENVFADVQTTN